MRICLSAFVFLIAALAGVHAAPIGPDVAVMEIQFGKEKKTQQVVIGLYDNAAPLTVANFKELAGKKFYNGLRFHRVFPSSLVQTGDPKTRWIGLPLGLGDSDRSGTGGPGYTIPAEIGRTHVRGTVAMSRLPDTINPAKASNGSQFYITLTPTPKLDGKYTVFGEVLEGLDVLDAISNERTDSNDFPLAKIVIKSITIQPRFAEPASPQ
ncbi:MAG: peptidylprolyl isomerase [Verrucomicrobiota bacterium]